MARTSDTLEVGDTCEALVLRVTPELNQQVLKALDSLHPRYEHVVHRGLLMNFSSIRSGIGKPVASGFMLEAYLAELLISFFGQTWLEGGETSVISVELAGEGDRVVPRAVIRARESEGAQAGMECELWCENQFGNKTMVGSARGRW
jgi:hypothetical protein